MRILSAFLLLAMFATGLLVMRHPHRASDYVPPMLGTASCAWHDRSGAHTQENGVTAYVRTGGTDVAPVITSFICENGFLYSVQGSAWPSTAVPDN